MSNRDIAILEVNRNLPFFGSQITVVSGFNDPLNMHIQIRGFNWIQAFYSSSIVGNPILAVWSGINFPDNTPQVNKVRFAYSGQMIPFHGGAILTSGIDVDGNTITSTPFNQFIEILRHGGMGGYD